MLRVSRAVLGGPPLLPQFIGGFGHQVRWATKKAAGSTKNGGTSPGQRLGLKKSGGQSVFVGQIIARQTGTKWRDGDGIGVGRDNTLFAMRDGVLRFRYHPDIKKTWAFIEPFDGNLTKAAKRRYKYDELKKEAKQARADNYAKRLALLAEIDAFNAKKADKGAVAASA